MAPGKGAPVCHARPVKEAGDNVADRGQAELIGKIILARFLQFPLKRFERFIEEAEADPLFKTLYKRGHIIVSRFSGAGTVEHPDKMPPHAIGVIRQAPRPESGKCGHDLIILYRHPGFGREYFSNGTAHLSGNGRAEVLARKLRLITTRNRITHEVLNGILRFQRGFFCSGNPLDLKPLTLTSLSRTINASQNGDTVVDHSRISRLVNGKSIITPSGGERPLRFFFPAMRDVHRRFVCKIVNEERRSLVSGEIKRPSTDKEIRDRLRHEYHLAITRRQVAFCRRELGIPNLYQRDKNNRYPPEWAGFSALYPLGAACVRENAPAGPGIYELGLKRAEIEYPQGISHLFYIGSAKNIRERLKEHLRPGTRNGGIKKYLEEHACFFRHILFNNNRHEKEKELYSSFMAIFGAPPVCNKISP
ncbi:MAG: hypothetical protein ABIL06_05985 [Pseudomonadota bacterium]